MYEFDSVSVSTFEATSLAAKLSEKSAAGWEVVAIVPAGSDITAYIKRSTTASATATAAETSASAAGEPATETATSTEPAGWGTAPESTSTPSTSESTWGQTAASGSSGWGSGAATSGGWGSGASTPAAATTTPTTPTQPSTPSVPAGWYIDPAGRFELRYWDGTAWTEHVSRNGQQFTDPPVA